VKNEISNNSFKLSFYGKLALIFISLFALVFALHIAQNIIAPLVFSFIIAIVLNPLVNYLISKRINKIIAIAIAVFLAIVFVAGILYVIFTQIAMLRETYPELKEKLSIVNADFMAWLANKLHMKQYEIVSWVDENQASAMDNIAYREILTKTLNVILVGLLIPVYVLMILYYKPLLLEFIKKLFRKEYQITVNDVLTNSKKIIQTYLVGLFFEFIIVAAMNSTGLLLLGIDYAIILGITGAVLNIVPYLGGILATALPMTIAFVTKDSITFPILVFFLYIFTQFVDNNYIIPKIVASRVQINALVSIIVVLIGSALWGIPGMFLSIPLTAIIKVIFDHIEPLKPLGFVLGNTLPVKGKFSLKK
jgi:predicted PurR-regulated permease PerM